MFESGRPVGLPIGTTAPRFVLPSLDGGVVIPEWFARDGRSALLVFGGVLDLDVTRQRQLRGNAVAPGNSGFLFVQDLKSLGGQEGESLSAD